VSAHLHARPSPSFAAGCCRAAAALWRNTHMPRTASPERCLCGRYERSRVGQGAARKRVGAAAGGHQRECLGGTWQSGACRQCASSSLAMPNLRRPICDALHGRRLGSCRGGTLAPLHTPPPTAPQLCCPAPFLQSQVRTTRRAQEGATTTRGAYIRVHLHPKRFPGAHAVDWARRVVASTDEYVVVSKPAGVPSAPTVDNWLESAPACTAQESSSGSRGAGEPPVPLPSLSLCPPFCA
jgi:hypothetical protein